MIRFRRYRVFAFFAFFTVIAFYKLTNIPQSGVARVTLPDWRATSNTDGQSPSGPGKLQEVAHESKKLDVTIPAAELHASPTIHKPLPSVSKPEQHPKPAESSAPPPHGGVGELGQYPSGPASFGQVVAIPGSSRLETDLPESVEEVIHWVRQKEHFPVPPQSLIKLPKGSPQKLPAVQTKFKKESEAEKAARMTKLGTIKSEFVFAWNGYKNNAWKHDEVLPVTGLPRSQFTNWGSTLVDSLDTIWIMGLKEEFEHAVKAVGEIDFTTTPRPDIPVFETTIRFLGGLLAAYEVSDNKYDVLLKKAVELAEILMGTFDTPNRTPLGYYYWRPDFASQPHKGDSRILLAEVGSLSMEFTKLAQLTKEDKYYDAVARLTDYLEEFQKKTRLPGMWPNAFDASGGCGLEMFDGDAPTPTTNESEGEKMVPLQKPSPVTFIATSEKNLKRQLNIPPGRVTLTPKASPSACVWKGLEASTGYGQETYSVGGEADSAYEYILKEYILLGGLVPKYKPMYINAAETIKKYILYRPMVPGSAPLLMAGKYIIPGPYGGGQAAPVFEPEQTHLTCFIGGFFAMGGKVFDRPEDVEIGAKLTEGCVWSYNSTATGIMPELSWLVPCEKVENCQWNETLWWEKIDPYAENRQSSYEAQVVAWKKETERAEAARSSASVASVASASSASAASTTSKASTTSAEPPNSIPQGIHNRPAVHPPSIVHFTNLPVISSPRPPTSHKDYVERRIKSEKLAKGMTSMQDRRYILRPEAIESVFYMYRITGDSHWREVGWNMFESTIRATRTEFGHSAIEDVTSEVPIPTNNMESFWLAETLKYYWLLFDDEDVWSLDDWVLNTEAHLFRRPK